MATTGQSYLYCNGSMVSANGTAQVLRTANGVSVIWYYTQKSPTLKLALIRSSTSQTAWPNTVNGGMSLEAGDVPGYVAMLNYAGGGGQPGNALYIFCPSTFYKDSSGYVYCTVNGQRYYLDTATGSNAPSTSRPSYNPPLQPDLVSVPLAAEIYATNGQTLSYTGSPCFHPLYLNYFSYFNFSYNYYATNAGDYFFTVTPKSGYCWANGSTGSKTVQWKITPEKQSFVLTGDTELNVFGGTGKITPTGSGALFLPDGYEYSSSDESVVKVDAEGNLTAGNRIGSATITVTNKAANNTNLTETSKTITVKVSLKDGYYIGEKPTADNGGSYQIYLTLQEAVDAAIAAGAETVIHVVGNPTEDKTVNLPQNAKVTIVGEDGATISRTSGFTGSIFAIENDGKLTLEKVTLDGKGVDGDSLISVAGTLNIGNQAAILNGNAENGGAVNVSAGGCVNVDSGAKFIGNTARQNGGAIYVNGGTLILNDGTFSENKANQNGGAVYVTGGQELTIHKADIRNNSAGNCGDGVTIANQTVLNLDCGSGTENFTDTIGIMASGAGTGKDNPADLSYIQVTNTDAADIVGTKYVQFENVARQSTEIVDGIIDDPTSLNYIRGQLGIVESGNLLPHFNATNDGYDFFPRSYDNKHCLIVTESNAENVVWTDEQGVTHTFASIAIALETIKNSGQKNPVLSFLAQNNDGTQKEIILTETIRIPEGMNITFNSVVKNGESYDISSIPVIIKRAVSLQAEMVTVKSGASLTLDNVIFDGGAVWDGGSISLIDDGQGGAGTVVTNNNGVIAHAPVIVNNGTLILESGAIIQNNENNYAAPGDGFGSQNYGGGVRNQGAGSFTMNEGASIQNCYSREGGAVMNVNKPGTEGSVENGNPTVTINGGTITGNVSQQKGAAIQTIYGGAATEIKGGTIENNWSLNDLGTLAIEEGGSLKVEGGILSAGSGTDLNNNNISNQNAIYVYNKYSDEDYENAATSPFIEGKSEAQITVTGAPAISGKIHLDGLCQVHGKDGLTFSPFLDARGYTGTNKLEIDLNEGEWYDKIAMADSEAILKDKITVTPAATVNNGGLSQSFTVIGATDDNGYALYHSGFEWKVNQTKPGELTVTGKVDSAIESLKITIGEQDYLISKNDGTIEADGTVHFTLENNTEADAEANIELTYAYIDAAGEKLIYTPGNAISLPTILFDAETGKITAPAGAEYKEENGEWAPLTNGTLPNDLAIDAFGNANFKVGGEERSVFLGIRAENVEYPIRAGVSDLTDRSITVKAQEGLEYNLIDKNGNLISSDWKIAENGEIVFTGLTSSEEYTVVVRTPVSDGKIPGKWVACPESTYQILSTEDSESKKAFDNAYTAIEDKLLNPDGNCTASTGEIEAVLAKYDALTNESIKELPSIKKKYNHLMQSYDQAQADRWKTTHKDVLDKVKNDTLIPDDMSAVITALEDYEKLSTGAQTIVLADQKSLLDKYAETIKEAIDAAAATAKDHGADNDATDHLAESYKGMVDQAPNAANARWVLEKAKAALKLRQEYDNILKNYDQDTELSKDGKTNLEEELDNQLDRIANATNSEDFSETVLNDYVAVLSFLTKKAEAEQDYLDSYQAITGKEANPGDSVVKAVIDRIRSAEDLDGINTALKNGVEDLLNGLLREKDSEATGEIIEDYLAKTAESANGATADGKVADLSEVVKDAGKAVADNRAAEKNRENGEIDRKVDAFNAERPDFADAANALREKAKTAVAAGDYADYAGIQAELDRGIAFLAAQAEAKQDYLDSYGAIIGKE